MTDPKAKAREAALNVWNYWSNHPTVSFRSAVERALDAYEAALSAPDGATRLVRIAVAEDDDGSVFAREAEG